MAASPAQRTLNYLRKQGWPHVQVTEVLYIIPPDEGKAIRSFYYEDNMALAWRVLNWWCGLGQGEGDYLDKWLGNKYWMIMKPGAAQHLWLDKILELAIEAGIVGVSDESD